MASNRWNPHTGPSSVGVRAASVQSFLPGGAGNVTKGVRLSPVAKAADKTPKKP